MASCRISWKPCSGGGEGRELHRRAGEKRTMGVTFPGESKEYRAARERLLEQEIELRRAMEAVAVARRELPRGGVAPEDYVFRVPERTATRPT